MLRFLLALTFLTGPLSWSQAIPTPEEVSAALSRAESLYFDAKFRDCIALLLPLDNALQTQSNRVKERVSIKVEMGLSDVGLNQTAEAKALFGDVYDLDPTYVMDPQLFAPKVIALFQEAKAEHSQQQCQTFCEKARKDLASGNFDSIVSPPPNHPTCGCMTPISTEAAELVYRQALDAYRKDDYAGALKKLRTALSINPEHALASQYVELTDTKIGLAIDRLLLEWRKHFDAGEVPEATANYRQVVALNIEGKATAALAQMRDAYRQRISGIMDQWNRACGSNDSAAISGLRNQATALLPDPAIGRDLTDQMNTCTVLGCLQAPQQLAMTRIKTRVNPDIPTSTRPKGPVTIHAKIRIDEAGNVTVSSIEGATITLNDAVRAALEKWKFTPALVDDRARCVETELAITIN
jgi:tetratricopeptide (TPR) repeat protein